MIACCNDGTRPVIFKIGRLDYKVIYVDASAQVQKEIAAALKTLNGVIDSVYRADKNFIEVYMDRNDEVSDDRIIAAVGKFKVLQID